MNKSKRKTRKKSSDKEYDPRKRNADARDGENRNDRSYGLNDISWYTKNPLILSAAASFPFPYKPGMSLKLGTDGDKTINYRIPGVAYMSWLPSVGRAREVTDPISIAAKEIFAKVREKFSGSIEADAPDFIIYLMSLDSIFSYIGMLKRVYRIVNAYTPYNYVTPDSLLFAMGIPTTAVPKVRANKMRFFQNINELISMTRKFMCPAVMDIFNRHYWMNDNVYTDAASPASQMYVFYQAGYYKYGLLDVGNDVKAGGLVMQLAPNLSSSSDPVQDLFDYGVNLIQALSESDDAYIISGYLMRAFEGSPIFSVDDLLGTEVFTPVYSEEVLSQIENSHPVNLNASLIDSNIAQFNVTQDPSTNTILGPYTFKGNPSASGSYTPVPRLSIRSDNPTPADVTIASRLHAAYVVTTPGTTTTPEVIEFFCGTELPLSWTIVPTYGTSESSGITTVLPVPFGKTYTNEADVAMSSAIMACSVLSQFDWSPIVDVKLVFGSQTSYHLFGDVHNFSTFTVDDIANLHKICVYSEFNAFNIN